MYDLFEGNPNLANVQVSVPVGALPKKDQMQALQDEHRRLIERIKERQAGVVALRVRLMATTNAIIALEVLK